MSPERTFLPDPPLPDRQTDLGRARTLLDDAIGLLDKHGLSVAAAHVSHAIEQLETDI